MLLIAALALTPTSHAGPPSPGNSPTSAYTVQVPTNLLLTTCGELDLTIGSAWWTVDRNDDASLNILVTNWGSELSPAVKVLVDPAPVNYPGDPRGELSDYSSFTLDVHPLAHAESDVVQASWSSGGGWPSADVFATFDLFTVTVDVDDEAGECDEGNNVMLVQGSLLPVL